MQDNLHEDTQSELPEQVDEEKQATDSTTQSELEELTPTSSTSLSELEALQQENMQLKQKHSLLLADFSTYRNRIDAEKARYAIMGNMVLLMQLADVKDDIGFAQSDTVLDLVQAKSMLETVKSKLATTMQSAGLMELSIQKGDKFDAKTMEAITTIQAPSEDAGGTVADIVAQGYKHAHTDQLIKTAKVVVYK